MMIRACNKVEDGTFIDHDFVFFYFFRLLCKFFAHGACLKGEHCEFSHDWKDPPNNVNTMF